MLKDDNILMKIVCCVNNVMDIYLRKCPKIKEKIASDY